MAKSSSTSTTDKPALKSKIASVKDAALDQTADQIETAHIRGLEMKDAIEDHAETTQLQMMDLQDQISEFVRRQPVASLGLAVGAGVLFGVLAGRR